MFCVKLWDVERAGAAIAPLVAKGGVVIPFQNGVGQCRASCSACSARNTCSAGVAYIAATIRERRA